MPPLLLLILCCAALTAVALLAALPSFLARKAPGTGRLAEYGDQFAMGVFIATGLVHMLPHAAHDLADIHPGFPLAFAIAAATLLALLLLSQFGQRHQSRTGLPIIATLVLVVHSLLEGAVLGATLGTLALLTLTAALFAHKGMAAFALSRLLIESPLSRRSALLLHGAFVVSLPLGAAIGESVLHHPGWEIASPIVMALGAGTFIYLGTAHIVANLHAGHLRSGLIAPVIGFLAMTALSAIA
ncbi:MAG: hypothetical protein CMN72_04715 [Sphingomonas sp.]|nr:hypothetical protein [Sphingomonas sp.]